jgi:hypothetical protein
MAGSAAKLLQLVEWHFGTIFVAAALRDGVQIGMLLIFIRAGFGPPSMSASKCTPSREIGERENSIHGRPERVDRRR